MPKRWQWDIRLCFLWTPLLPLLGLWKVGNLAKREGPYLTWNCCSFTKRKATLVCTLGICNPVNVTIFNLNETGWEVGKKFDILICKKETDPSTLLQSEFPISVTAKNLLLSLAESIAQILNATSCYVCGRTNIGDHWPWEAKQLNPQEPFNEIPQPWRQHLTPKTSIIGNYCISHPKGQFFTPVGDLIYLGQKFYSDTAQETQWWGGPNHTELQYPGIISIWVTAVCRLMMQIADWCRLIKEITDKIKKKNNLAHVSVQTWKGQSPNDLLEAGSQP
jgi:hypothetical protein